MNMFKENEPALCTTSQLEEFTELIKEGGEVVNVGLYTRVKNSKLLAWAENDDGDMVSIGALKRPNKSYQERVFTKSGNISAIHDYKYELGFLYTSPESRGKGLTSSIIANLIKNLKGDGCYSTLREDNSVSKHLLTKNGFVQLGSSYKGVRRSYDLVLYVRRD